MKPHLAVAIPLVVASAAFAQSVVLQQRIGAIKQSIAENKERLRQYQWIETTQLTVRGDAKPPSQQLCRYGPDGQVQKTPIGPLEEVKGLISQYVPPDPQRIETARMAGKVELNPAASSVNLVIRDYVQTGDQMTLTFDTDGRVVALSVNSYMGEARDAVTLQVRMASLPDGTNYAQQTVLNAIAKQLQATITNADYQRLSFN
jgi:hypothetical protein